MNRIDSINPAIPRKLLGYDRARVDGLMRDMADALAKVTEEKIALSAKLREVEARFAEMKEREAAAREALAVAAKMGDDIRAAAQKEAQLILETARLKAGGLLQNAELRLARIMEEAAEAQKDKTLFEMRLRAIIEDHLRLLDINRQKSSRLEAVAERRAARNAASPPDGGETESGDA